MILKSEQSKLDNTGQWRCCELIASVLIKCTKYIKGSQPFLDISSRVFQRLVRAIIWPKSDSFLSKSVLLSYCILWSWVRTFWTSLLPPKEFRNQKLSFSTAANLPSS